MKANRKARWNECVGDPGDNLICLYACRVFSPVQGTGGVSVTLQNSADNFSASPLLLLPRCCCWQRPTSHKLDQTNMKPEWAAAMTESIHTSTIKNTWETTSLLLLTSWRRTARLGATTTRRGLWASRRAGSSAAMSDGAFSFSLLGQGKGKEEIIVSPWSTRCWAQQRSWGCWVKEITNWWTIDSCFLSCLTLRGAID